MPDVPADAQPGGQPARRSPEQCLGRRGIDFAYSPLPETCKLYRPSLQVLPTIGDVIPTNATFERQLFTKRGLAGGVAAIEGPRVHSLAHPTSLAPGFLSGRIHR